MGRQESYPPTYLLYIHIGSHTLGGISGNHFNQPYRVTDRVLGLVSELFVAAFASVSKTFKGLTD